MGNLAANIPGAVQAVFGDKFAEAKQQVLNMAMPATLPSPESLIGLVTHGMCSPSWVADELLKLGIPIFKDGKITKNHGLGQVWGAVMENSLHLPDPEMAWNYCVSHYPNPKKAWETYLKRTGANIEWWSKMETMLWPRPEIGEILDQYAGGFLTLDELREWLSYQGARLGHWDRELADRYNWPSALDVIDAVRRGFIKRDKMEFVFPGSGIPTALYEGEDSLVFPFKRNENDNEIFNYRDYLIDLVNWIPSPGDLVGMMVKDVFTPTIANEFKLFDDYNDSVDKWFEKLGMTGDIGIEANVNGEKSPLHWGHMHWGAHWRNLGASQFFQFMHRIRKDNEAALRAKGFDVKEFTLDRVRMGLKTDDYPPGMRDYLAAVSYRPLEVRRLQQGAILGYLTHDQVKAAWLDHGYDSDNAEIATKITLGWAKYQKDANVRTLERALPRRILKETLEEYRVGILERPGALEILRRYIKREGVAEGFLDLEDARLNRELIAQAVKAVQKRFKDGLDTHDKAIETLVAAGISQQRADMYVRLWSLQRTRKERAVSTSQVLKWLTAGAISEEEAAEYLKNLGWTGDVAAIEMALAEAKRDRLQARAEAAEERPARERARILARVQRDLEQMGKEIQRSMRQATPIARLRRWFADGLIDIDQFRHRMAAIGVPASTIELEIADILKKTEDATMRAEERQNRKANKVKHVAPILTFLKWLRMGIITEDQFRQQCKMMGGTDEECNNWIRQVQLDKANKASREAKRNKGQASPPMPKSSE